MKKRAKTVPMHRTREMRDNLAYWFSRPPAERVAEVERLRQLVCGPVQRIEKVVRICKLSEK